MGVNCPGGKLFRGNPVGKRPEGNFLGENFIGGSCPGVIFQGSGVQFPRRNFIGINCPGGNVRIP